MKKSALLISLICVCFTTSFGQKSQLNNVLIFSKPTAEFRPINQAAIEVFYRTSLAHKSKIDTTSNPAFFKEENLKNYNCIVFLNTSANALKYPQLVDFQRFMQANGGFVGIHAAAEKVNASIWYQNMIAANVESSASEKVSMSIITNASLGKTEVQPFWKIDDKPLIVSELSSKCKPVLLDLQSKTLAWHYTTDEGGKMFYTTLGGDISAYQTPDFIAHIWSGIEEVSAKELPDFSKSAASALPNESFFLKQTLTQSLIQPVAFTTLPNGNCVVVEQNGQLLLYKNETRKLNNIANLDILGSTKKLKLDPDFAQNGYIYAFLTTKTEEFIVKRLQLMGDSVAVLSDFTSNSSTPLLNSAKYNFAQFESKTYRFPKYYDGKTFRFDPKEGFIVESFNENGELKNSEPFLANSKFNSVNNLEFGSDGALYFFEENRLVKIDYSEKNRPPVAMISADIQEGKAPLKVQFSSDGSYDLNNDALSFLWQFDALNTSTEANPIFTFAKLGNYNVKLQVADSQGLISEKTILITVEKGGKTPVRKRH